MADCANAIRCKEGNFILTIISKTDGITIPQYKSQSKLMESGVYKVEARLEIK